MDFSFRVYEYNHSLTQLMAHISIRKQYKPIQKMQFRSYEYKNINLAINIKNEVKTNCDEDNYRI